MSRRCFIALTSATLAVTAFNPVNGDLASQLANVFHPSQAIAAETTSQESSSLPFAAVAGAALGSALTYAATSSRSKSSTSASESTTPNTTEEKISLTYFDLAGRAEMIRLAFKIGGVDFEDIRVAQEDWPALKPKTPLGSLPVLGLDGREYAQSMAVVRYAGKKSGLYPSDPEQAVKVDEILDILVDINSGMHLGLPDDVAEGVRAHFIDAVLPAIIGKLEERLKVFGGDGPFVLGKEISIADLAFLSQRWFFTSSIVKFIPTDAFDKYDCVMRIVNAVNNHPVVMEWNKEHSA